MAIHTKDIVDDAVFRTVQNAYKTGEEQFKLFVKERFVERIKPVTYPLLKNNLATFSTSKKIVSKHKTKAQILKEDCSLFSRLYIASQTRDGNLEEFFTYENQPWSPSFSQLGQLRGGQKADLLKCLPDTSTTVHTHSVVDAVILDGAVARRTNARTSNIPHIRRIFQKQICTLLYILQQLENAKRVDQATPSRNHCGRRGDLDNGEKS